MVAQRCKTDQIGRSDSIKDHNTIRINQCELAKNIRSSSEGLLESFLDALLRGQPPPCTSTGDSIERGKRGGQLVEPGAERADAEYFLEARRCCERPTYHRFGHIIDSFVQVLVSPPTFFFVPTVPPILSFCFSPFCTRSMQRSRHHLNPVPFPSPPKRPCELRRRRGQISASSVTQPQRFPDSPAHWPTPVIYQAGQGGHSACARRKQGFPETRPPICLFDSAVRRSRSGRTKYSPVV